MPRDDVHARLIEAIRSVPLDDQLQQSVIASGRLRDVIVGISSREPGLTEVAALHRLTIACQQLMNDAASARNAQLASLVAQGVPTTVIARRCGMTRHEAWKRSRRGDHRNGATRPGDPQ